MNLSFFFSDTTEVHQQCPDFQECMMMIDEVKMVAGAPMNNPNYTQGSEFGSVGQETGSVGEETGSMGQEGGSQQPSDNSNGAEQMNQMMSLMSNASFFCQ